MKRDIKIEQAFQDLNLIFCELSSFLLLASQRRSPQRPAAHAKAVRPGKQKRAGATAGSLSIVQARQVERVSAYITQLLQGRAASGIIQSSIPRPVTPQAYIALLPTIWCLLNGQKPELSVSSDAIFAIVLEHATRVSSTSAVKRHAVDFVGRLIMVRVRVFSTRIIITKCMDSWMERPSTSARSQVKGKT